MSYSGLQVYGIGIQAAHARLNSIGIEAVHTQLNSIAIQADNQFNGSIQVFDSSNNVISGATVEITSTQTPTGISSLPLSGTTDSDGLFNADKSSTVGTTLTVSKSGFHSYTGPLTGNHLSSNPMIIVLKPMKKIYVTNRGNIVINPNDSTLFELS